MSEDRTHHIEYPPPQVTSPVGIGEPTTQMVMAVVRERDRMAAVNAEHIAGGCDCECHEVPE